jgi:DNA-binding transcriptional LysR family regulator
VDLRQLEIFVKVAELKSFSRAADALSLTQPTVSEHIRALEDEVGVRLLDRLGRGAAPTRAGDLLLGHARRILALKRDAVQALERFQGRMTGELMVGGSTIPGEYVLPALIGRFKDKFPDISISLLIGDSRQVCDWVIDGRVELAVAGARPSHRALESTELMPDELVVVLPTGHPWAGLRTVTVAELQREPLIVRERGSGSREALERALADAGSDLGRFRVVGEMGSTQAIKQGVRAGVGLSLISRRAVLEDCRLGLLHCVTLSDLEVARAFHVVTHRTRTRSPLADAFLAFLASDRPAGGSQGT